MSSDAYPPDWSKRRTTVLHRDDWTCTECGFEYTQDADRSLHVHHVKPISEGGGHGLDNLVTLCGTCHTDAHRTGTPNPSKVPMYPCSYCGHDYPDGHGYGGSYCSTECWSRHKAEKAIGQIDSDGRICSSCFSTFPGTAESCPRCGNWEPNEDNREMIDATDVDVTSLLAHVLRTWKNIDPD